jgi:hypothetical protein
MTDSDKIEIIPVLISIDFSTRDYSILPGGVL